jgi:hypothetical protein
VILLAGFTPVAGPYLDLKITVLDVKPYTLVRTYVPVFRRKISRSVQGRLSR